MKKKNKIRVLRFIISFCAIVIMYIVPLHFFSFRFMGPQPWSEIFRYWWIPLQVGILGAIVTTFVFDDKPPFWEKLKKKKKSE